MKKVWEWGSGGSEESVGVGEVSMFSGPKKSEEVKKE